MAVVFLSLGSNLGDRKKLLRKAAGLLNLKNEKRSTIYETEPWGRKDQPWFLNMAVKGETDLSPGELLKFAKKIEKSLGRRQNAARQKYEPRTIDIDILFYNDLTIAKPKLKIPHPLIAKRRFVLTPLAEIAPRFTHPASGKKIKTLLKECADASDCKKMRGPAQ